MKEITKPILIPDLKSGVLDPAQFPIRIGILGCANIVQKHIIAALKEVPACRLAAIASRDQAKGEQWARKFGCRQESYENLLRSPNIDAVYLPLPVGLHKEWVIKAALAGKHILCEKSLADNFLSVQEMVRICQEKQLHLYENFMCDYHPQHQEVISLIENKKIGKEVLFSGSFGFPPLEAVNIRYQKNLGGGALNDVGTYLLFMSRKIFNCEPETVTAQLEFQENEVDIRGHAFLEFPGARAAFISFGFDNFYQNNYTIWGEQGLIKVQRAYSIPPDMKPEVEVHMGNSSTRLDLAAANHFVLIFSNFCEAIRQNRPPRYAHLLAQARAMEALRISARENRKVRLSEI